jgi:hypothetical protein
MSSMTTKRYSKKGRLSRSSTGQYPFERRYAALQGSEEHPVDTIIDRIPQIATLDRDLARQARRWAGEVRDVQGFNHFEDRRLSQRTLREEAFFDAGHEHGRTRGRAESLSASMATNPAAWEVARAIYLSALGWRLRGPRLVAVLLELARAVALGRRIPGSGDTRRRRRTGNA